MKQNQIIDILKINPKAYRYIDFTYKTPDFIISVLKENIDITSYLEDIFLTNLDIFKYSFKLDSKNILFFNLYLFKEKMIALNDYPDIWNKLHLNQDDIPKAIEEFKKILIKHPYGYKFAPDEVLSDENVAIKCLEIYPDSFEYLKSFHDNKDFALKAIKKYAKNYNFVSVKLKSNLDFIEKAIDVNEDVYKELDFNIRLRKDLSLKAIKKSWKVYYMLPIDLKKEYEFLDLFYKNADFKVLDIKIDNELENYFLKKYPQKNYFKNNIEDDIDLSPKEWYHSLNIEEQIKKENILKALDLKIEASSLSYWGIDDSDFLLEVLEKDSSCVNSLSFSIPNNEKFIIKAIENGANPALIIIDPNNLSDNILQVILENNCLQFIIAYSYLFQNKEKIIINALKKNSEILNFDLVPLNREFLIEAVKVNPKILNNSYKINPSKEILEAALFFQKNYIPTEILYNPDYNIFLDEPFLKRIFRFIEQLRKNGEILDDNIYDFLKYIPDNLKRNQELILAYIKSGGSDFKFFNQLITEIMLKLLTNQAFGRNSIRTTYLLDPVDYLPPKMLFEEIIEDVFSISILVNKTLLMKELNRNLNKIKQLLIENTLTVEQNIFLISLFLEDNDFRNNIKISNKIILTEIDSIFPIIEDYLMEPNFVIKDSSFIDYSRLLIIKDKFDDDLFSIINTKNNFTFLETKMKSDNYLIEDLKSFIKRIFKIEKLNQDIEVNTDIIIIENKSFEIKNLIKSDTDIRSPKKNTINLFSNILIELFNKQKSILTIEDIISLYPEQNLSYEKFYNFFRREPYKRLNILAKNFNDISKNYQLNLSGSGKDLKIQVLKKTS